MKQLILTGILLTSLLLSACAPDRSIGVIGGDDGPTEIYVNSERSEKKPVRMIQVDGNLYYDSGKVSNITSRCGTMDGNLKKSANEYEIPQEDGECNFEGAKGYQNATEITKEILIDGDWVIFKKMDDPQKDLLKYKYCYCLKGTMPNAVKESELIVLANDMDLDFERVTKSFTSSSSNDFLDIYAVPLLEEDKWGITLTATDVTPKGLTVCCEQLGGCPTGELQTGDWYTIEKNHDGNWEPVESKVPKEEIAWHSIAYVIPKNDKTKWKVDWEWLYGELSPGVYRIGKRIDDFRKSGDYDSEVYYADFNIN